MLLSRLMICRWTDNAKWMEITEKELVTFRIVEMPVPGVVIEKKLETEGVVDPEREAFQQKLPDSDQ